MNGNFKFIFLQPLTSVWLKNACFGSNLVIQLNKTVFVFFKKTCFQRLKVQRIYSYFKNVIKEKHFQFHFRLVSRRFYFYHIVQFFSRLIPFPLTVHSLRSLYLLTCKIYSNSENQRFCFNLNSMLTFSDFESVAVICP